MKTKAISKLPDLMPVGFDDFFKPWNEWFENGLWNKSLQMPAVNIAEKKDEYLVSLAAPGLKKEDFKIEVDNNMLTINSEKEDTKEEKDKKFTRKEYNYSSFSRSFTLPEGIKVDKIDAKYHDGILQISLPRTEESKLTSPKLISVK